MHTHTYVYMAIKLRWCGGHVYQISINQIKYRLITKVIWSFTNFPVFPTPSDFYSVFAFFSRTTLHFSIP